MMTLGEAICHRVIDTFPALGLFPATVRFIVEHAAVMLEDEHGIPLHEVAHLFLVKPALHATIAALAYTKLSGARHWQC